MSKFWGLYLLPLIMVILSIIFFILPMVDKKGNIKKFIHYYDGMIIVLMLFLLAVHMHIIAWNLGHELNPVYVISISTAVLFFYIGILFEHVKQNNFVGIRTPWTLGDERVWDKTHKLGAILFKISGFFALLGIVFPDYAIALILIPVLSSVVATCIYSYRAHKLYIGKKQETDQKRR